MARSANVNPLSLHNIKLGDPDAIELCFDESKCDKTGKRVTPKNVFANPLQPQICWFTAMGVWMMKQRDQLSEREKLFLKFGGEKSCSSRFCTKFKELIQRHSDIAEAFVRPGHGSGHGIRKGNL